MFSGDMPGRWRELHGSDRWDGLLDPLDADLRRCLITYGEMIMATYEAFIAERRSPNAGMCRYRRANLLRRVEVSRPEWYEVTRYIYATAGADVHGKVLLRPLCRNGRARECNWMGYVAVATDEGAAALGRRDVVVAWRGTQRALEWVADMKLAFASAAGILGPEGADGSDPSVHRGYLSLYTSSDQSSELSKQSARMQVRVLCFFRETRHFCDPNNSCIYVIHLYLFFLSHSQSHTYSNLQISVAFSFFLQGL
jgi:hypothetical protein